MKMLITGVSGFVGGHLLRQFSEKKTEHALQIVATARSSDTGQQLAKNVHDYFQADLSKSCPSVTAEVCLHAAGLADDRSSAAELLAANVTATRNLLDALHGCKLFVHVSSASIYGRKDGPLTESDATVESALSEYGRSKWLGEQTVREICDRRGIAHVILRPRAIYGIGDRVLLPRLMRLMRPPLLMLIGEGTAPMSLTHIDHLGAVVAGLVFAAAPPKAGIFNIADAAVYRMRDVLAALYAAIHGKPPRIVSVPVTLVRSYLAINETCGLKGALSRQSLGYLTEACVLDCTRALDILRFAPSSTFYNHLTAIARSARAAHE